MAQRSLAIDAVVGAEFMRRGGSFTWRGRSFRIGLESATISLRYGHDFRLKKTHEASKPFDGLQLDERSRFTDPVRRDHDVSPPPAADRDLLSMKISRLIAINSRPSIDADRELLRMPRGAR